MLFSIILPTYNRAKMLPVAIESVLLQEYTNWELIIVDDGSTDNTKQVVQQYNDNRIKYIWQENQERSAARNNGINKASGNYICFLDSDDYLLSNHLAEFYSCIEQNGEKFAIYFCNTMCEYKGEISEVKQTYINTRNSIEFAFANTIGVPRVCIPTRYMLKHNFNPLISIGEDKDLWIRIASELNFIHNNKYTTVYKEHDNRSVSLSNTRSFIDTYHLLKQLRNKNSKHISSRIANKTISTALFNIAKSYIYLHMNGKAAEYILRSIFKCPFMKVNIHRVLLILSLWGGYKKQILNEYREA